MSRSVHLYVSDESYECALYLARLAHKDPLWVMTQWLIFAKDKAVDGHPGLCQHMESWRADKLREFQRTLVDAIEVEPDDPPF